MYLIYGVGELFNQLLTNLTGSYVMAGILIIVFLMFLMFITYQNGYFIIVSMGLLLMSIRLWDNLFYSLGVIVISIFGVIIGLMFWKMIKKGDNA